MSEKNSESSKKLTVTIDENIAIPSYDIFLIRGNAEYMEVQLATKAETDTEITVNVESIFRINKHAVPQFARQFSKYLQDVIDEQKDPEQPKV